MAVVAYWHQLMGKHKRRNQPYLDIHGPFGYHLLPVPGYLRQYFYLFGLLCRPAYCIVLFAALQHPLLCT
jgi:hypothetical protein